MRLVSNDVSGTFGGSAYFGVADKSGALYGSTGFPNSAFIVSVPVEANRCMAFKAVSSGFLSAITASVPTITNKKIVFTFMLLNFFGLLGLFSILVFLKALRRPRTPE